MANPPQDPNDELQEYKILRAKDVETLEYKVNTFILEGWFPIGGPFSAQGKDNFGEKIQVFHQAIGRFTARTQLEETVAWLDRYRPTKDEFE